MFYIFLDTCVFLDISTKKQELPLVSALEELVRTKVAKLVVIDLVAQEYERNKKHKKTGEPTYDVHSGKPSKKLQ